MSYFNRVAALLDGCPDPGGVLYPKPSSVLCPAGASPPRHPYVPKVAQLVLPASGVTVRQLAELLGLPAFLVMREFINLGLFFTSSAQADHAAISRLCARLGVSIAPAA